MSKVSDRKRHMGLQLAIEISEKVLHSYVGILRRIIWITPKVEAEHCSKISQLIINRHTVTMIQ